jgi:hypothetical protein
MVRIRFTFKIGCDSWGGLGEHYGKVGTAGMGLGRIDGVGETSGEPKVIPVINTHRGGG